MNKIVKTQDSIKTANGKDSVVTKTKTVYTTNLPTNMELAKNLKGHLMLIVGNMDGNVHPAQTIRMADALINHGKDFELVFLPRGRHTYDGVQSGILNISYVLILPNTYLETLQTQVSMTSKPMNMIK